MRKRTRTSDAVRLAAFGALWSRLFGRTFGTTSAPKLRSTMCRPATPGQMLAKRRRRAANKVARRQRRVNRLRSQR